MRKEDCGHKAVLELGVAGNGVIVEFHHEEQREIMNFKILQVGNMIFHSNRIRRADTVMVNPLNSHLVGEIYGMNVVYDENLPGDAVFIKSSQLEDLDFMCRDIKGKDGYVIEMAEVVVRSKQSKEEADAFMRNSRGYIEIIR